MITCYNCDSDGNNDTCNNEFMMNKPVQETLPTVTCWKGGCVKWIYKDIGNKFLEQKYF